jgi:hypothetical protein
VARAVIRALPISPFDVIAVVLFKAAKRLFDCPSSKLALCGSANIASHAIKKTPVYEVRQFVLPQNCLIPFSPRPIALNVELRGCALLRSPA